MKLCLVRYGFTPPCFYLSLNIITNGANSKNKNTFGSRKKMAGNKKMRIQIALFLVLSIGTQSYCQTDTTKRLEVSKTTSKTSIFNKYPPHLDTTNNTIVLRNELAPFGRKFLRANIVTLAAEAVAFGVLYLSPETFSKWDPPKQRLSEFSVHYKEAFTQPPIIDKDYWYINYLGHPYQGAYVYNTLRSQGATKSQSSLFTLGHSFLWEYVIEGGVERPSTQDLIITPIGGVILGELLHIATVEMSKNGFKWYEVAFVCIFNPAYAFDNGFKFDRQKKSSIDAAP